MSKAKAKKLPLFTIQIEQSIVVSHEFRAENIEEASKLAQKVSDGEWLIGPKSKAWTLEWESDSKVIGVLFHSGE